MAQARAFLSRRKLIAAVGGTVAAGAALMALPIRTVISMTLRDLVRQQPTLRRLLISLADANYDEWRDQVGTNFAVGGGTSLKLVSVAPLATRGQRPARLNRSSAFILNFDVQNRGTMASDLIYTASHPSYGAFKIFLSASSDPNLPHRMTALFN